MKGLRKRITCLFCTVIITTTALLSCPLRVQATTVPAAMDAEASIEALMILWNLLVNGMLAGGAAEAVADYDNEKDLFNAFMDFMYSATGVPEPSVMTFEVDGVTYTINDLQSVIDKGTVTMPDWWVDEWDVDEETGEDVIQLPNEQVWGKYRVGFNDDFASILEAWEKRGGGSGDSGEPEEPKSPDFKKIKSFTIGAGFLAMISEFFTSVFNGEVENVPADLVFDVNEYVWTGEYERNANGTVALKGYVMHTTSTYGSKYIYNKTLASSYKPFVVHELGADGSQKFSYYYLDNTEIKEINLGYSRQAYNSSGVLTGTYSGNGQALNFAEPELLTYGFNIPMFYSLGQAQAYFNIVDDTYDIENRLVFDQAGLISSIPTTLASLVGKELSPDLLQKLYAQMKTAYETEIEPNTTTDTQTNTEDYTETMTETVTDTLTDTETEPVPTPGVPDIPTTPDGPIIDDIPEVDDYKRDLRMIFPFCLPFDFIALLQALDAEPETPRFEIPFVVPALDIEMTVDFNLSFLDDVMENLRKIELVGFIVFLIFATGKVIKW